MMGELAKKLDVQHALGIPVMIVVGVLNAPMCVLHKKELVLYFLFVHGTYTTVVLIIHGYLCVIEFMYPII
jgi:hypothetical protein